MLIYNYIFLGWNVAVMLIYGTDKLLAKGGRRRISERSLLLSAFLLGGIGAMFGMVLFNHKTSKKRFRFLVPTFAVLTCLGVWLVFEKLI